MYAPLQGMSSPSSYEVYQPASVVKRRGSWCMPVFLFVLLAVGLLWLTSVPTVYTSSLSTPPVIVDETIQIIDDAVNRDDLPGPQARPQLRTLYGDMMSGKGHVPTRVPRGPSEPMHAEVQEMGGVRPTTSITNLLASGAFELSDPGKEYMAAYNPTGLASVMPAGWRAPASSEEGGDSAPDKSYSEFSRYSITPEAITRSENIRSVMRFSENTRQGLGRTLGYQSLLRNFVTPVSARPLSDQSMLWNDSTIRQGYISGSGQDLPPVCPC
jgi:hypothetical protein